MMKKGNTWKWSVVTVALCVFTIRACADTIKMPIVAVDQDDLPVEGVQLSSGFGNKVTTGKRGKAKLGFKKHVSGGRIWAKKEGYYDSETQEYFPISKEFDPSKNIRIKLKKIKNPISMWVNKTGYLKIPIIGKKAGYDLVAGDWVAPHGKGKVADFVFLHQGVRRWSGPKYYKEEYEQKITLRFSNKHDGVIAWKGTSEAGRRYGSKLVSDYEAPLIGYQSKWEQRTWKEKGGAHQTTTDIDRNFYFRVRTKVDAKGNIISAHYGKIYGDFMSFIYYLNPTPNDRNVEFDPKKNLFKNEKVTRP